MRLQRSLTAALGNSPISEKWESVASARLVFPVLGGRTGLLLPEAQPASDGMGADDLGLLFCGDSRALAFVCGRGTENQEGSIF